MYTSLQKNFVGGTFMIGKIRTFSKFPDLAASILILGTSQNSVRIAYNVS